MFERTFSFWRRLVGLKPNARQAEERRLWVRYRTEFNTMAYTHEGSEKNSLSVRVRDISQGGANLMVDQSFATGQLISLELPVPHEDTTQSVLACVVRVEEEAPGQWSLGCVFSRELGDDDLEDFGAKRVRHENADNRIWKRFPTTIQAKYQIVGDISEQNYLAQVLNLSASGVGLVVDQEMEGGSLLNLELLGHDGQVSRTILTCVVHVSQKGPNEWALGCNFIHELSETDLHALV